jgi:hypothetical protein
MRIDYIRRKKKGLYKNKVLQDKKKSQNNTK